MNPHVKLQRYKNKEIVSREMLSVKGYKFSVIRQLTSWNLMYRIITKSNNTVLYTCIHIYILYNKGKSKHIYVIKKQDFYSKWKEIQIQNVRM